MKKYFKNLFIAFFIASGSLSTTIYQACGSEAYQPTQRAPRSLKEANDLAKLIGTYNNSQPDFSPVIEHGKANNQAEALAKMKAMHCTARLEGEFNIKSCFNTGNTIILKNIYDLVIDHPDEYIVDRGGKHYLIKKISDSSHVGIEGNLGFSSSDMKTPLNIVSFTIAGIRTSGGGWDIRNARILSVYLISEEEYSAIPKVSVIKN